MTPYDPNRETDDFDAPFGGIPDAAWDAGYVRKLPPYPAVPAAADDHDCPLSTWPLLVLAVVAVCSFALAARLIVEG